VAVAAVLLQATPEQTVVLAVAVLLVHLEVLEHLGRDLMVVPLAV
jgi:hypothetical protein